MYKEAAKIKFYIKLLPYSKMFLISLQRLIK